MKNNKGFMLAEAVITSTVVLTTLIGLYATFTKLYNAYNIRTTYFDIDGMYAIKGMIDHLIDNGEVNNKLQNLQSATTNYISLIQNNVCQTSDIYCSSLTKLYDIENLYIIKYETESLSSLKNIISRQTFKDYLEYIRNYYTFDTEEDGYNYLFILEYKNGDKYYYSSLGLG